MVEALSHITLMVSNLNVTEEMLVTVFDAEKIYDSGNETFSVSQERFFMVGSVWVATMKGDPLPSKTYNHIAFKIDDADYDKYLARIEGLGMEIKDGRSRVTGEGRSIYFYGPDNHLFELHTGTLQDRLARYGVVDD